MKNKLLKGKSVYITSVGVASPLILQLPRDVKNLQNLLYTLKYHLPPLYTYCYNVIIWPLPDGHFILTLIISGCGR